MGLALLQDFAAPDWLISSYMWVAVLADLHRRNGNVDAALRYRDIALNSAPTPIVKALLQRRLHIESHD